MSVVALQAPGIVRRLDLLGQPRLALNVRHAGVYRINDRLADVAAHHVGALFGEQRRQRQADLAQADDRDLHVYRS